MTKKRVIAFDCDDVVLETAYPTLAYYNGRFGANVEPKNFYCNDPTVWRASSRQVVSDRIQRFMTTLEYQRLAPTAEAVYTLRLLSERYDLYVVTGRSDHYAGITKNSLQTHLPGIFKSVIFTNYSCETARPKSQVCREIGADVLVEDHLYHATAAAKDGINVLLFGDYPWNQADNLLPNITRVSGWRDIAERLL